MFWRCWGPKLALRIEVRVGYRSFLNTTSSARNKTLRRAEEDVRPIVYVFARQPDETFELALKNVDPIFVNRLREKRYRRFS